MDLPLAVSKYSQGALLRSHGWHCGRPASHFVFRCLGYQSTIDPKNCRCIATLRKPQKSRLYPNKGWSQCVYVEKHLYVCACCVCAWVGGCVNELSGRGGAGECKLTSRHLQQAVNV